MNKDINKLKGLNACYTGLEWFNTQPDLKTAWKVCERGDWMLWYCTRIGVNKHSLTLAKAHCAGLVMHLMKDERSRNAIRVAKRYGMYKATEEELRKAADAADDAATNAYSDAVYYAYYDDANAAAYYADYAAANAAAYAADVTYYVSNATAAAAATNATTAAYYGTKESIQKQQADICRKYLSKYIK